LKHFSDCVFDGSLCRKNRKTDDSVTQSADQSSEYAGAQQAFVTIFSAKTQISRIAEYPTSRNEEKPNQGDKILNTTLAKKHHFVSPVVLVRLFRFPLLRIARLKLSQLFCPIPYPCREGAAPLDGACFYWALSSFGRTESH